MEHHQGCQVHHGVQGFFPRMLVGQECTELSEKMELFEMLEALGEPVLELAWKPAPVEQVLWELGTSLGAEESDYRLAYFLEAWERGKVQVRV